MPTPAPGSGVFLIRFANVRRPWIAVVLAGILSLAACGPDDAPRPTGEAKRIVSLYPTATEILFALGAGDRVVARSSWCEFPPEVEALPALGDAVSVSAESVIALRPDLVLVASGSQEEALSRLEGRTTVLRVAADGVTDVKSLIGDLAQRTGRDEQGRVLAAAIDTALAEAAARAAGRDPVRVLFVVQREPLVVAGKGSYVDELLDAVGAVNVAADAPGQWPALSEESLVKRAPDVILDGATTDPGDFWNRFPGRAVVRPVRETVVLRPGPRLPEALLVLERLVTGEPK